MTAKEKAIKGVSMLLVTLLTSLALSLPQKADAKDTKTYNWYPKFSSKAALPSVMPEAAHFFDKYNAVFMGSSENKKIYLTFDSGYENGITGQILDTLKEKGVTAAFFLDGNYIRRNPDLVKRMAAENHLVCNHSLKHPDMTKMTDFEVYKLQLIEWERLCQQLEIPYVKLFRPPMGKFSEQSLQYDMELGYTTMFWSVAYADWDPDKQPTEADAMAKLTAKAHNGAVYLLHSVSKTNNAILPRLIDELRNMGYSLASPSDFLNPNL